MKLFFDQVRSKGRTALALVIAMGAIGFSGGALSAPCLSLDPAACIPAGTNFSIKFVDREIQITGLGQELFGIFLLTQINSADGTVSFFNNGDSGRSLVGFFEGLISEADETLGTGLSFDNGTFSVFNVPFGSYSPGTTPNTKNYANQLCGAPGCLPPAWLTANFVSGINDALGPTGQASLQAAFAATNVQAGFGYMSVTGGLHGAQFDTNGFTFPVNNFPNADLFLRSNFVLATPQTCIANNGWQVCSDDPVIGKSVPEPATLLLIGLGALAAGAVRRKKAA